MTRVHATAIVTGDVELGAGAEVGPLCVLDGSFGPVRLGEGVKLMHRVTILGPATIGARTVMYPGVTIGMPGQDLKLKPGDATAGVVVGADCMLRENATIHAATKVERPTTLGERVFMMVNAHVGHDSLVGHRVVMVNNAALGGHAQVGDDANLGGGALVHQFGRVGRMAMVGGASAVSTELPPFFVATGRQVSTGINVVGLRRKGFRREEITALRWAYRTLFATRTPNKEMIEVLRSRAGEFPTLGELADFVASTRRGIMPPARARRHRLAAVELEVGE